MNNVFRPPQTKSSLVWVIILMLIIDVPILSILFFSFQTVSILFVVLIAVLVIVDALLLSLAFLGKNMTFTVQENEFLVSFGFSKRKIAYSSIKDMKVSNTALLFRLFGASWPGLHWGLYSTRDLGKVWAYSTKISGDFVVIELVDENKILVSPKEFRQLCDALNSKRSQFGTVTDVQAMDSSKLFVYLQVAAVAGAFFVFLGYLLWIYPTLPETIPVHFDLNMIPNRWGHKSELFIIAGIAAVFPVLNSVLVLKFGKYAKTMTVFLGVMFVLLMALFFVITYFTQSIV